MEFVSGVATDVTTRLASYAAQEVSLAWGAQLELKNLNKTMLTIKLVLGDAEQKQINNPLITHWLGNLKDVCNDAEDVLDDFDFQKLRQQVIVNKSRSSRVKAKVHQFFSRWNPVVFNFKMGHKLQEIRVRLDEIDREKRQFSLDRAVEASHVPPRVQNRERMTDSVLEPLAIIGRDGDKQQIIKHLLSDSTNHSTDDDNLSVISIVGLGGLGKTTLVKLVYNDDVVQGNFQKKMWVCVSENFVIETLVESIIVAATEKNSEYPNLDLMKRGLQQTLGGKKFLLVLDDVWDTRTTGVTSSKWRELKTLLNVGANGSKIVVTTRNQSVVSLMDSVHTHNLEGLDEDDCISLFMRRAFRKGDEQHYPHLVKIGEEIVEKCGGIPLAIDALGSMLHSKTEQRDWVRVRDQMFSSKGNDMTMQALQLSYDALPSYLKPCFAFCSLFPKDYEFNSVDIVSLWMAQGYLTSSSSGVVQSFEEMGLNYVREFCSRSLFQIQTDLTTLMYFKIHDLVHDLAIYVAKVGYSTVNSRPTDAFEKVRHVSISIKDLPEDENSVPEFMLQSQKLRTILFPDEAKGAINSLFLRTCFSRFKFMRVIDLRESTIGEIPSSIGNLSHLRYLHLSNNKMIRRLPNSICRLLKLESLEFGGCTALEEIPKDIGNLINLRYLGISTQQVYLPKGTFRGLNLLQSLLFGNCIHLKSFGEELKYLLNLRVLFIQGCENLESLSSDLKNLQAFDTLWIDGCEKLELMKSGQGIRGLRSVSISTLSLEALPDWLHESANTLRSILIIDCDNLMTLPEWLADLKLLEGLVIGACPKLSALPQGLHRLTALRELRIGGCPELSKGCKRQFKDEEWARFVHDLKKIELDDDLSDDEEDEVVSDDEEDEVADQIINED